jgi:CBS domain containing-hemolysin-like protein
MSSLCLQGLVECDQRFQSGLFVDGTMVLSEEPIQQFCDWPEAGEQLNSDEVTIISAVLDLKEKSVGSIMTPMEDVHSEDIFHWCHDAADRLLFEVENCTDNGHFIRVELMDHILSQGYSRIPIHAPENPMNFVGMLLVKMLITPSCVRPRQCRQT